MWRIWLQTCSLNLFIKSYLQYIMLVFVFPQNLFLLIKRIEPKQHRMYNIRQYLNLRLQIEQTPPFLPPDPLSLPHKPSHPPIHIPNFHIDIPPTFNLVILLDPLPYSLKNLLDGHVGVVVGVLEVLGLEGLDCLLEGC